MNFSDSGPIVTKRWLFERVTEEEVLEFYTGCKVETGYHFRSPVRKDNNPTCSYNYGQDGRPRFKDWALDRTYDCIDLVRSLFGCGYQQSLDKIAFDFNLTDKDIDAHKQQLASHRRELHSSDRYSDGPRTMISIARKSLTAGDLRYFFAFGISPATLGRYHVHGVSKLWVNDKTVYWGSPDDPAVAYFFGTRQGVELWKIYFYRRDQSRFLCNTDRVQGWPQLPDSGEFGVITKSLKDVMVLSELGVPAIAPQGEGIPIASPILDAFETRFGDVYSLYDYDYTGIKAANNLKHERGYIPFFVHKYGAKDVSDLVRNSGMDRVRILLSEFRSRRSKGEFEEIRSTSNRSSRNRDYSNPPWVSPKKGQQYAHSVAIHAA